MGTWRFRRSIGIVPGVRLNLTHTGIGATFGPRGLHYSLHSSGRRTFTVGLPGTGLYWQDVKYARSRAASSASSAATTELGRAARAGDADALRAVAEAAPTEPAGAGTEQGSSADEGLVALALSAFIRLQTGEQPAAVARDLEMLRNAGTALDAAVDATNDPAFEDLRVNVAVVPTLPLLLPLGYEAVALALAETALRAGDPDRAVEVLAQLPATPHSLLVLLCVLCELGRYDAAVAVGHVDPDGDVTAMYAALRAEALRESARDTEALELLDEALTAPDLSPSVRHELLIERALTFARAGRGTAASADVQRVLAEDPDHPQAAHIAEQLAVGLTPSREDRSTSESELLAAPPPEEAELRRREAERDSLEAELTEARIVQAALRADIEVFDRRHLDALGDRYLRADRLRAQIAALRCAAEDTPRRRAAEQAARERVRATEETMAQQGAGSGAAPLPLEAKSLFKRLIKRLHPDLATDPEDRTDREALTKALTRAWAAGDLDALNDLDRRTRHRTGAAPSTDASSIGDRLVRALRRIAELREELERVIQDTDALRASPSGRLIVRAAAARADGVDLLAQMATQLDSEIAELQAELDRLCKAA